MKLSPPKYVWIILVATLFAGAPSLIYPFGRDQGEYAYTAQAALQGRVVYRDVFCVKPPMTHVVHEAALIAFGHSMQSIRMLDLLWQITTALLIAGITRRLFRSDILATLAGVLYALAYYSFEFWHTAQTDGFLNLPVALAFWGFIVGLGRPRPWPFLMAGAAIGVAVLFKYPIGILLPMLAAFLLFARRPVALRSAGMMTLGFLVPVLCCLALLVAQGALRDFISINTHYFVKYNLATTGNKSYAASLAAGILDAWRTRFTVKLMSLALVAGCVLLNRRGEERQSVALILLWWLAAAVHLLVQNKFYPYHWLPLAAPCAVLAACAIVRTADAIHTRRPLSRHMLAGAVAVLATAAFVGRYIERYQLFVRVLLNKTSLTTAQREFRLPAHSVYQVLDLADYVRAHTQPSETIFIWGFEPAVYFLSARPCASRFIYNFPLFGDFGWPELRALCMTDLDRNRPRYIIIGRRDSVASVTGLREDSEAALSHFSELIELLTQRYQSESTSEHFTLYRRH